MPKPKPKIPSYPYRISMKLRQEYTLSDMPNSPIRGWVNYQNKQEKTMLGQNVLVSPSYNCTIPNGGRGADKVVPDRGKTLLGQPYTANKMWGIVGHMKKFANNTGDVMEIRVTKTNDSNLKDKIEILYTNPNTNVQQWWQITQNVNPIAVGAHEYYFTSWYDTNLNGVSLNITRAIWTNGNNTVGSWTGGIAPITSVGSNTLSIASGKTWAQLGFVDTLFGGSGNIVVNGLVYTIVSGWGTNTVTLSGSTAGISVNDLAFDQIVISPITVPSVLAYTQTGSPVISFITSEVVTGGTSGATGVIINNEQNSYMTLQTVSGTFQVGETITGGTSHGNGIVGSFSATNVTFDVCSQFKNYVVYGSWAMRSFYMSNGFNRTAEQGVTNAQASQNDLVVSGSYTGTGKHVFRVTIDSISPAIKNQFLTSAQGGNATAYFNTNGYNAVGNNTYVMSIISDLVVTPNSISGTFVDNEYVFGSTSGAVFVIVADSANTGGAFLCKVFSGTPKKGETITGQTSGATATVFAVLNANSAQFFKNNTQITGITGMVNFGSVLGIIQLTSIASYTLIDGLTFVITGIGANFPGDYYTLQIQNERADTFQVQIDGALAAAGETGISIVPATAILTYTSLTGTFVVNGKVLGATSGATGYISSLSTGTLNLSQVVGTFQVGESISTTNEIPTNATATVATQQNTSATQPLYAINPNGVNISFTSSIGHAVGDFWDITVNQSITSGWVNFYYSVPARRPGEGYVGLLPSNFWAEIRQEDMMYVNDTNGGWSTIETKLSANLQSESIVVSPLKGTTQSKVIYPYMLGYLDNAIVYVNTEKKLDLIARKAFLQLPQISHLSDPVKYDFLAASFIGGSVEFWDQKFWVSSPIEGVMFCYDNVHKYWNPPKYFPEMGFLSVIFSKNLQPSSGVITYSGGSGTFQIGEEIRGGTSGAVGIVTSIITGGTTTLNLYTPSGTFQVGETITGLTSGATGVVATYFSPPLVTSAQDILIAHSNVRNQSFTLFTSNNGDNGLPYTVNVRTSPWSFRNPWGTKTTSMSFIEGYMQGNVPLVHRFYLEPNGEGGVYTHDVDPVIAEIGDSAPFGEGTFGEHQFGSDTSDVISYFREIYKSYAPVLSYYFISSELTCTTLNHSWQLLSLGANSVGGNYNNKNLVNKNSVLKSVQNNNQNS